MTSNNCNTSLIKGFGPNVSPPCARAQGARLARGAWGYLRCRGRCRASQPTVAPSPSVPDAYTAFYLFSPRCRCRSRVPPPRAIAQSSESPVCRVTQSQITVSLTLFSVIRLCDVFQIQEQARFTSACLSQRLSLSTLHLLCPVFGCLLKRRAARSRGDSFGRKIYLLLLTQSRRDAPTRIAHKSSSPDLLLTSTSPLTPFKFSQ